MKNILIFNDMSPETEHATELALLLAGTTNVRLYIWNTINKAEKPIAEAMIAAGTNKTLIKVPVNKNSWIEELESKVHLQTGLKTNVTFVNDVDFAAVNVLSVVKRFNIGLLIKGIAENEDHISYIGRDALSCSTKSGCPILLAPEKFPCKAFERIVYATDLRFCRRDVILFLSKLTMNLNASILVANIAANGLPYMEDNYALDVFNDMIAHSARASNEHFYFNNIRERNIRKAIDVLVNDMHTDLLVLTNHRYHFNELLGASIPYILPGYIQIPVMIFPS
ncbi:MAG TPA: hypothetical protein VGN20_26115 [Mucilaginibacter sp.]|jgi:hypothetical protein